MNVLLDIFQMAACYTVGFYRRLLLGMQCVSRNVNCGYSCMLEGTFHQKIKRKTFPSWCNVLCSKLF